MIDVHCHLDYTQNPKEILRECQGKGMTAVITSLIEIEKAKEIFALKKEFKNFLFVSFGFHPESVSKALDEEIENYLNFAREKRKEIVALGEVGLDYSFDNFDKQKQKLIFGKFVDLAKELNLPLICHCRQAFEDLFEILKEKNASKVVLHCFSGSEGILKEALNRGYFISFATNICYTQKHPRLAEKTPLEKIVLETDAPWLDPDSQGKEFQNRPWKILNSAKVIAQIKKISVPELLEITTSNSKKIFNLVK